MTTGRVCSRVWHAVTAGAADGRCPTQRSEAAASGESDVAKNEPLNEAMQPSETPLELPARVVTARLVRGAFYSPRRSRKQHLISTRRDGTGLPDSFWVLRSDTATALRRGLAFDYFEEEEEDSK